MVWIKFSFYNSSYSQNRTIVIGFLLEDLDRSIFKKRDYEKVSLN